MDLRGKVAVVTGSARGLGRAFAVALADAGCDVAVSDLGRTGDSVVTYRLSSHDELAETARLVEARGRRALAVPADVTQAAQLERLMAETEAALGGIDCVVANAGIIAAGPVVGTDEAVWDRIFAVNTKGVFLTCRAAIPYLVKRGGGRIVNVASVAGKTGRAALTAYCASKAAVINFTQGLAEELGPLGIAANALCPGFIKTAMFRDVLSHTLTALYGGTPDEAFQDFIAHQTFLKRPQTPEEIADAAVFLCRAENVTGTTLVVAGGGEVH